MLVSIWTKTGLRKESIQSDYSSLINQPHVCYRHYNLPDRPPFVIEKLEDRLDWEHIGQL